MAAEYHITPEGPRRCSVDKSNPKSKGCPFGGVHFDSFDDAMEVYTEELRETFGDFHVLVRPTAKERARRVGYRSLDGIERAKADPRVQGAVAKLKAAGAKAREAVKELQSEKSVEDSQRASTLPDSIATEPLLEQTAEDREPAGTSEELFGSGTPEPLSDFGSRIMARSGAVSFRMAPLDRSEADKVIAAIDAREMIRKTPAPSASRRFRAYRSATKRRINTAKLQASYALDSGAQLAKRRLSDAGYTAKASVAVARDTAELRGRVAAARLQDSAQDLGRAVQKRATLMSLPAGHIRPGDTFDGTTVRSVELLESGKVKISYQAKPGGPVLAATVPGNRSMSVDRRTRREARNSRISSKLAGPIAETRALSERVRRASEDQLALFTPLVRSSPRASAIDRSILQQERSLRQREIIDELRELRSRASSRILQRA